MVKMVLPSFVVLHRSTERLVSWEFKVKPLCQYDLIRGLGMLLT